MNFEVCLSEAVVNGPCVCKVSITNDSSISSHVSSLTAQLLNIRDESQSKDRGVRKWIKKTKGSKHIVQRTDPKLILTDTIFLPGDTLNEDFVDKLPKDWLPTFKGKLLRFKTTLRLDIFVRENDSLVLRQETKWFDLEVTPSVLMDQLESLSDWARVPEQEVPENQEDEALERTNPFAIESHRPDGCYLSLETLNAIGAKSGFKAKICHSPNSEVARLHLKRRIFRPGDVICGSLAFPDPKDEEDDDNILTCSHYSISLISKEEVMPEIGESKIRMTKEVVCQSSDVVIGTDRTGFRLQIPDTHHQIIRPSFVSPFGSHLWDLDFEFGLMKTSTQTSKVDFWRAPEKISLKNLHWTTPVAIVPST